MRQRWHRCPAGALHVHDQQVSRLLRLPPPPCQSQRHCRSPVHVPAHVAAQVVLDAPLHQLIRLLLLLKAVEQQALQCNAGQGRCRAGRREEQVAAGAWCQVCKQEQRRRQQGSSGTSARSRHKPPVSWPATAGSAAAALHLHGQRLPVVGKFLEDDICILDTLLVLLGLQGSEGGGWGSSGWRSEAAGRVGGPPAAAAAAAGPTWRAARRRGRGPSDGNVAFPPGPAGCPMALPAAPPAGGMQDGAMAGCRTSYCLANCLNSAASLLGSTRLSVLEAIVLPHCPVLLQGVGGAPGSYYWQINTDRSRSLPSGEREGLAHVAAATFSAFFSPWAGRPWQWRIAAKYIPGVGNHCQQAVGCSQPATPELEMPARATCHRMICI